MQIPVGPAAAALSTLKTVFKITDISLESFSKAFALMPSFDMVAAAADRIEWEGALIKGVSAFRDIIGAEDGRKRERKRVRESGGEKKKGRRHSETE